LLVSGGLDGNERVVAIAGAFLRVGEAVAVSPFADMPPIKPTAAMAGGGNTVSAQ
jgi:hypothetical protein